eukprot:s1350_g5.t1
MGGRADPLMEQKAAEARKKEAAEARCRPSKSSNWVSQPGEIFLQSLGLHGLRGNFKWPEIQFWHVRRQAYYGDLRVQLEMARFGGRMANTSKFLYKMPKVYQR